MRLTLRTLLAYLDDVLEPTETKQIGQKIQESAVAGKLVSLIRLVVRQRRLKAPSVSGPHIGIDPNVVAQYLDNTLAAEQVVDVEKVLLTSDELLAEVASCHQVMALASGKPAEVSLASRERLYALGPVAQADQLQVDEPAGTTVNGAIAAARETERAAGAASPKPASHEIPDYLRQSSWSQRAFPAAIVALLVIVCAGLLISDPGFLTGIREAKRELNNTGRDAEKPSAATGSKADDVTGAGNNPVVAANTPRTPATPRNTPAIPPSPSLPPGLDPNPRPDEPEPVAGKKPVPPGDIPADAALVANRTPAPGTVTAPANTVPANTISIGNDPAPILSPALVQYTSGDGVVLRWDATQRHWFLLPRRSVVPPGELLAVLEPFEAVLDVDRGATMATVMGDSVLRLLPPDRATAWGLDVRRGRILLRSSRKEGTPAPVTSIMVGGDLWKLEFVSADTVCTIEVSPREPVQFEKTLGQNWYAGVLRVLSGSVKWTTADGQSQQVGNEMSLDIAPQQPGPVATQTPVSSTMVPEWTDAQKRKQAPLRRHAVQFEKEFELDQPVEMSLLSLIKHPNAKIVELAVHGLAMTESHAGMVQALAECGFEEGRFAARDGIRTWLARSPDRGPALKELLEQRYPVADAAALYILLWGFRPEDVTNKATSLEIINWLRNPQHVEIRELAYYWVVNLTGRKWEFRASEIPGRRESAVKKIEAHVQSVGALVKDSAPKKTE